MEREQGDILRAFGQSWVWSSLVFTGENSPVANPLLWIMGVFAEFERIREGQRESIALAKPARSLKGRRW